jgi:flavorubredoxin
LKKALIVYYKENEDAKYSNEEKAAFELEKHFQKKGISVHKTQLKTVKKLGIKEQQKKEKEIKFASNPPKINDFDFLVIGTPIVGSLTSSPVINAYIRSIPKKSNTKTKTILYATGIIPGFAIKKMQSLLSMQGIKTTDSEAFTSIFEFDEKKLLEIKKFFDRFIEKSANQKN